MKKWQKAEKKDAKLFDAKTQRGSGNQDHYPTDAVSDQYAIETKYTEKGSYSISLERWQKLVEEVAVLNQKDGKNRMPIFSLHIGSRHLVVLDYEDFEVVKEKAWMYDDLSD